MRRYAEGLFTQLAADGTAPALPPGGLHMPGSWLAPAIEALVLILSGDDALEPLSRAAQLDEAGTALFLCLALAISGNGDRIHASWLGTAFGELSADRPVTPGQRALWTAAARGAYGPAGKIFVLRKLDASGVSSAIEPDLWLRALAPEDASAASPAMTTLPALADVPELAEPVRAASRLKRLLERCTEITSTRPPLIPRGERPGPWPDTEPLTVLRSLVHAEEPGPLGALSAHLLDDIQPGSDPYLAAIAFHVAAPVVRTAAGELAEATGVAPPSEITVPLLGHEVILRPEGPDVPSLTAAEAAIHAEGAARRSSRWLVYGPALLPVAALVLAFTVSELFAVASLVLGGIAGFLLWRANVREQAEARRVEAEITRLREQAEAAVWALHDYAREAEQRSTTAQENLTALTRLLRRGPAVADQRPPASR
ncbi:hypothetical protein DQ384_35230 [Sphaerisporangium album]|uniref:Uncharacterized protein n=1 Tax=Sphaerisporangium album TaxID=509200 RepID=A0A367EW60_9ACTN|nr:hypothetical protein [Sphaerisporangium album]RCG22386.1 hypothetical protein DQ384_35230 [Sphaerisporangium album]